MFKRGTIIIDIPKLIKNVISQSIFWVVLKRKFNTKPMHTQTMNEINDIISDSKQIPPNSFVLYFTTSVKPFIKYSRTHFEQITTPK